MRQRGDGNNANYMAVKSGRVYRFRATATHEFIVTLSKEAKGHGVTAMDFETLLDFGLHARPLTSALDSECLLIEPTETETKEEMEPLLSTR